IDRMTAASVNSRQAPEKKSLRGCFAAWTCITKFPCRIGQLSQQYADNCLSRTQTAGMRPVITPLREAFGPCAEDANDNLASGFPDSEHVSFTLNRSPGPGVCTCFRQKRPHCLQGRR